MHEKDVVIDSGPMFVLKFYFAWYDMWIGAYYDRSKKSLYICVLPCCVLKIVLNPDGPFGENK